MVKVRTSSVHIQNADVNFPIIGKATIKDGILEVPEELAEMLIKADDWEYLDKPKKKAKIEKKKVTPKLEFEEEPAGITDDATETLKQEEVVEEDDADTDDEELDLDSLSLKQLCEVAEASDVRGWEKFKAKKDVLLALIKKKLKK
jgi:hypothetical protein